MQSVYFRLAVFPCVTPFLSLLTLARGSVSRFECTHLQVAVLSNRSSKRRPRVGTHTRPRVVHESAHGEHLHNRVHVLSGGQLGTYSFSEVMRWKGRREGEGVVTIPWGHFPSS